MEKLPRVKKVFIRSGIRFDYLMEDKNDAFFRKLVKDNVSGQLKVAPEHCSSAVLSCMGKPNFEVYEKFREKFFDITHSVGKEQYLVPYLMSSHPGSTLKDAIELAVDSGKISTSLMQRRLEVGYGRAAKLIDFMAEMNVVGEYAGAKPRDVLWTEQYYAEYKMRALEDQPID